MKFAVGLAGLLIALAVVGLLSKRVLQTPPPAALPASAPPAATVKEQSLNTQQQFKQAVEGALATPHQQERP